jgi:hypothetical protein
MLRGEPFDARRDTKEIQQLREVIIDHGRMVYRLYSYQPVRIEVRELAFRLRETTQNVVTALVLLEDEGWASVPSMTDCGNYECSPRRVITRCSRAMKISEESKHEEQLPQPTNQRRTKPYEAPRIAILKPDQAKAYLVARVLAGDRDAEKLLKLVS